MARLITKGYPHYLKLFGYAPDVPLADVDKVTPDRIVRAAANFQTFDGTVGKADGIIGGKTKRCMKERLCLHPDYGDQELAEANPEDIAVKLLGDPSDAGILLGGIVACMHQRALGSGSWPHNCHDNIYPHPNFHAVTYLVNRSTFPQHYFYAVRDSELNDILTVGVWEITKEELFDRWNGQPMLEVAFWLAGEAARRSGTAVIEVAEAAYADIINLSRYIPGSTIGLGWFPDGTCRDTVEAHYDSGYRPGLHAFAWLIAHEAYGHCRSLPHTFSRQDHHRGVMSYRPKYPFEGFSRGVAPWTLPRDPSWDQLIRQFGDEVAPLPDADPTPPDQPTPPTPQPPTPQPPQPPQPPTPQPPINNPIFNMITAIFNLLTDLIKRRPLVGIGLLVVIVVVLLRSCGSTDQRALPELPVGNVPDEVHSPSDSEK